MIGLLFPGANVANRGKIVWGMALAFAYGMITGGIIGYVVAIMNRNG